MWSSGASARHHDCPVLAALGALRPPLELVEPALLLADEPDEPELSDVLVASSVLVLLAAVAVSAESSLQPSSVVLSPS